ncbi:carboxypeptidase-like regulatory domain-containing protein [Fulvivirga aurantia]|uniref:carboxypeptidase-like regulatory domain-containing protein n=1 Tax=Fulvivirga aurantia TaxID=2529383 RepID=UPI00162872ED|nr:carboxypeptidase-like regulatory domain-containing protein [Fulvivirga aurantia]
MTASFMVLSTLTFAQIKKDPIRLTGVVMDADNGKEVPFVSIQVSGTQYGTSSDNSGYFSIFINPGDTLNFTSIGYKDAAFVMPFKLGTKTYSLVQLLIKETRLLEEVVVFPWPTLENFERAFLDVDVQEVGMDQVVSEVKRDMNDAVNDSREYEYYYDQMRYQRLYELHGKIPPNNFLNPARWSNFINDVKQGKFKKED